MRATPALLVLLSVGACAPRKSAPVQESATLGGEVAARVNGDPIPLAVVTQVAAAQKISMDEAVQRVIDDAVASRAARDRGLDRRPPAAWQLEAARARLTSNRLLDDARRAGPPNDAEVDRLTKMHWAEVDRPPSVRVQHALVMRPKNEADTARVKATAPGLLAAVTGAKDAPDFEARAKAYLEGLGKSVTTRVESLPPFTAEGLVTDGQGIMDATFAAAAFAIPTVGANSAVIETPFGWHVIRLVERLPERRMPLEMRRIAFADEIVAYRAHDQLVRRLDALKAGHPVVIADDADALMQSVSRPPPLPTP